MHSTSHSTSRPTRVVFRDGERRTVRASRPGRSNARRAAIREQMAVSR
jgi:hypothetical protein